MQNHKFRAWDKEKEVWVNDVYISQEGWHFQQSIDDHNPNIEILLFTGLYDCKGREIYKGDVVNDGRVGLVEYIPEISSFLVSTTHKGQECLQGLGIGKPRLENTEVIGNIYENPELLERSGE